MSLESNQPGDLPPILAQYAGSSSLSSLPFHVQEPALIMHSSEPFSSVQHDTSHFSQPLQGEFNFEHKTIPHIAMGNVEAQCSGLNLDPIQQFGLQIPPVGSCIAGNYQEPGNDGNDLNSFATPNTSTHFDTSVYISQHSMNDSERLQAPDMRKYFDTSHQVSQNFTYNSNNAQPQNPQPYFSIRQPPPEDSTYHPSNVQTIDTESRFDMSHRTGPDFSHYSSSAQPLNSGYYIDVSHQKPSKFLQQFNYPFHLPVPAIMNPIDQYHESLPLMDNPHFQQCRSYDARKQRDMVYHPHGDGLHAANALQNVLAQQEKGSRAAEQAFLARVERQRIGDCPPVGYRREKRRSSERGAGRHFQQESMFEGRISTEREGVNPASKNPSSIEKIVFTTPATPENFTHPIQKDDMMQIESPAKKRKTSGSHENKPSRNGLTVTSPVFLQDDAMSAAMSRLTPVSSSKLSAKSPTVSIKYLSLSQIATISTPVQHHAQSCEMPNIGPQSVGFASHSNPLIGCQHRVTDSTLPSPMLGPDRNIPWPEGVPWPIGRHPVSVRGSASPKKSRAIKSDLGGYLTPDLGINNSSILPLVPIILTNDQYDKMLPDGVLSGKVLPGSEDAVFSLLDLSNATESCASMPLIKHQYIFSSRHHSFVEKQFETPFRSYVHPDIGKITLTTPAVVPQNLEILGIDSSEGV